MGTHAKDDGIVDDLQDVAHTQDLATVSKSSPQVDRDFAWWQFSPLQGTAFMEPEEF